MTFNGNVLARREGIAFLQSTPSPATNIHILPVQEHNVRSVHRAVEPRKAAYPDGMNGTVLKESTNQFSEVFTKITVILGRMVTILTILYLNTDSGISQPIFLIKDFLTKPPHTIKVAC